ncbi:MAG: sulfatase-like hydrolase/transferase [Akkermansiaceae bacterium]|nr:sulfatase-like hydrolase/transferase [Akkermansiaceae bacterium]
MIQSPLLRLHFAALAVTAAFGSPALLADDLGKPNIVFILADDQGYGDVTALNSNGKIPTPNIDRIAREGMFFTDAHTSSSVCTPTRYSVVTGRYHWRTRLQNGVLGGFSRPLIDADRLTVAGFLKGQGYHTSCVGKWHLGLDWPLKNGQVADDAGDFSKGYEDGWKVDYTAPIQHGPVDLGFDRFFGISASLDMPPYVFIRDRVPTEVATVEKAFFRKGPAGADFEAVDVLPAFAKEAVSIIADRAEAAKKGDPFFIYLPFNAPHTPIVPTPEWKGKSGINDYADFTMQVDASVGQVLAALDEHGLAGNTLLIFTTDNGCSPAANIPGLQAAGHEPSYIYRGHKADIFEGGHRVPFVVRWPGKIAPGSKSDQLIGQIDLMATCAEILGAKLPDTAGEDSVSFLPALLGQDTSGMRTGIVSQSINGSFAIRDGVWKLCLCPGSGGWSAPKPGKDDVSGLPEVQLYDLAADPGETKNLAPEHPDRIAAMKASLASLIERGRSTPGPDLKNDVPIEMIKPHPAPKAGGKKAAGRKN